MGPMGPPRAPASKFWQTIDAAVKETKDWPAWKTAGIVEPSKPQPRIPEREHDWAITRLTKSGRSTVFERGFLAALTSIAKGCSTGAPGCMCLRDTAWLALTDAGLDPRKLT